MITLLFAATLAVSNLVELVEPAANEVSIQALVKLPQLGAKDMAKLEVLVHAIPKETEDYPRREQLVITNGQPVLCDLTSDRVRIAVNVLPSNLKAGLSLMDSLVHKATLTQDNLDAADLALSQPSYWGAALDPTIRPRVKLSQDEAQVLYHRVFRPERLLLSVGGQFVGGQAQEEWERRMENWNVEPMPKGYFDISEPTYRTQNPGSVTTIDLIGAPVVAGDAALPTRILALFALGSGKGASLFRVVRERHGWSYRQEAILSPTITGWTPHLLIASIPTDEISKRVETIKSELSEDVKSWTDTDRARALGMADAVLMRGVPFSPLYVLGTSPIGNSLEDRTYMNGYWQMKTGRRWDPAGLLDSMRHVTLDDLRAQAGDILTTAIPRILPGS